MYRRQGGRLLPVGLLLVALLAVNGTVFARLQAPVLIEAEHPLMQRGSTGTDSKAGASGGAVLGHEFGTDFGDYAEYTVAIRSPMDPAYLSVRYARAFAGNGSLRVALDGREVGSLTYRPSGGWGDDSTQFRVATLRICPLKVGRHRIRLTVSENGTAKRSGTSKMESNGRVSPVIRAGGRADKNSVGHGKNIALYTGTPSRFFYATHELGDVFSAVDGHTLEWFPDHIRVSPTAPANINLDTITLSSSPPQGAESVIPTTEPEGVTQERQICVTQDDVVLSRIRVTNSGTVAVNTTVRVSGDCRNSFDWRGSKGGKKETRVGNDGSVTLVDHNVFPEVMPEGLFLVIGSSHRPKMTQVAEQGTYASTYVLSVPARGQAVLTVACAMHHDENTARQNLALVLRQDDSIAVNRRDWERFYRDCVPSFTCSDPKLTELYDFRWFLLQFSTTGGNLGLFRYPVVLEGRQAFQTYCCYSAPFMAFDRNWSIDPMAGWGHIASMVDAAYDDGRFPWYVSPRTNHVPLDHASKTGLSLLPWTLWRWYQIHGDRGRLRTLYPGMAKNVRWWIRDRDPDGNGLFSIDHQLETGMDDLFRRWKTGKPARYEAVDATVYAYLNLRAVAKMAHELGKPEEAQYFDTYAAKSANALRTVCWNAKEHRFLDRNPDTGEMADYDSICTFYPLMTDICNREQLSLIRNHLLNPKQYWTAHPIPALSQTDPDFDPVKGYWRGSSWPAATSHVIEGFATTAKRLDRSLLPEAAVLFRRAATNHLQPHADFYERYDPFTGRGLSGFRDYMHSWWIDIYIRHVAGLMIEDDGSVTIDPLPLGLKRYALHNVPVRGHRVEVLFNDEETGPGLVVRCDGKTIAQKADFTPGGTPLHLSLPR